MYQYNKPKKKKIGLTPYFIYIKQLIKMGKKSMVRWEKEYCHTGKEVLSGFLPCRKGNHINRI